MRGELTREQFAQRLGVTPLTVYRWELPEGAAQARRPRGKVAARLAELAGTQSAARPDAPLGAAQGHAMASSAPVPPSAAELAALEPILEHLVQGDFARAQDALLALFASSALRTLSARVLGSQALARCQLWSRGDALGAYATLMPLLAPLNEGVLPAKVALEVHVTAAQVYASFDGRMFDAGKINAHVAAAEPLLTPDSDAQRILLWSAQVFGAYMLNDHGLLGHVLARRSEMPSGERSPLLRCFLLQARLVQHYFAVTPERSAPAFRELVELTTAHGFVFFQVRALVQAARDRCDESAPPDEVLALTDKANALCREAGVATGLQLLYGAYAEGEARFRKGELARAEQVWTEGIAFAHELRWVWGSLPFFRVRSLLLTGRQHQIGAVVQQATARVGSFLPELTRMLDTALAALAELIATAEPSARARALRQLDAAVRELASVQAWPFARRTTALVNLAASVFAGEPEHAEDALAFAEETLRELPAAWAGTALGALRGALALRRGEHSRARTQLETALAGFETAQDRVSAALVRRLLALIALDRAQPDAEAKLSETAAELEALGLRLPAGFETRAAPSQDETPDEDRPALGARGARGPLASRIHALCERAEDERALASRLLEAVGELYPEALAASLAPRPAPRPPAASSEPDDLPDLPGFIAASASMRRLKHDLARLARSRATVLIQGESGSGKEVVARALHDLSTRASRAYVAFNCAAIPRDLFEGQLFGYRKGSFTGATSDHPGVIRTAAGGTLFLDEIAELPLDLQPKLLRFLENGEVLPLGETRALHVDVRVIAASFRDLGKLVHDGKFREDLYYRLQVVPLRVPPLRERPEDIAALARHFVARLTAAGESPPVLASDALHALTSYPWPGNVRELRNALERTLAFEPGKTVLGAADLRLR